MTETESVPTTSIGDLVQEPGELRFTLAGPTGERVVRFWGDVPASIGPPAEVALASSLLPAMAVGGHLSLPAPISPQLRRMLPDIQAVLANIAARGEATDRGLASVEVTTTDPGPAQCGGTEPPADLGVGAFFSGGVDSWATLLANPDVTDLIYVHGYDIPLDRSDASAEVERRLAESAATQGRRLHVVRTDLRTLLDASVPWEITHGPALAAIGLMFAPILRRVLIGSTATYAEPVARGSHPLHDHLWSTERCRIEHFGAHLTRTAKIEQLAECQEALDVLRVCWQHVDRYNCGRCEKCLRTMVALEATGALDRCPTFVAGLDLDTVAGLRLTDSDLPIWWRENLDLARRRQPRSELVTAIEACLKANEPPPEEEGAELRDRLSEAHAREQALAHDLNSVLTSQSWRLTKPLRRIGAAARQVRRRAPP
jgi:hypothetical protein